MRTPGTAAELEVRRKIGGRLLLKGKSVAEVARIVGVSWTTAKRWKTDAEKGGVEALTAKPHPGRPPKLSKQQLEELHELLLKGAMAAGYANDLWTCPRVAKLIEDHFGVTFHKDYAWTILHNLGWSCQMPQQRSRKQDADEVGKFRTRHWRRIKKGASRES